MHAPLDASNQILAILKETIGGVKSVKKSRNRRRPLIVLTFLDIARWSLFTSMYASSQQSGLQSVSMIFLRAKSVIEVGFVITQKKERKKVRIAKKN